MAQSVQTRFLIISDTHGIDLTKYTRAALASSSVNEYGHKPLPEVDVVLHCGDITENGGLENYRRSMEGLASIKAELKLVIAGNHDIDLDREYYEQECGGQDESATTDKAMALWRSKLATDSGVVFLEDGTPGGGNPRVRVEHRRHVQALCFSLHSSLRPVSISIPQQGRQIQLHRYTTICCQCFD